jgi:hypothetical protein
VDPQHLVQCVVDRGAVVSVGGFGIKPFVYQK